MAVLGVSAQSAREARAKKAALVSCTGMGRVQIIQLAEPGRPADDRRLGEFQLIDPHGSLVLVGALSGT